MGSYGRVPGGPLPTSFSASYRKGFATSLCLTNIVGRDRLGAEALGQLLPLAWRHFLTCYPSTPCPTAAVTARIEPPYPPSILRHRNRRGGGQGLHPQRIPKHLLPRQCSVVPSIDFRNASEIRLL